MLLFGDLPLPLTVSSIILNALTTPYLPHHTPKEKKKRIFADDDHANGTLHFFIDIYVRSLLQ
jgi:hypothetical protein